MILRSVSQDLVDHCESQTCFFVHLGRSDGNYERSRLGNVGRESPTVSWSRRRKCRVNRKRLHGANATDLGISTTELLDKAIARWTQHKLTVQSFLASFSYGTATKAVQDSLGTAPNIRCSIVTLLSTSLYVIKIRLFHACFDRTLLSIHMSSRVYFVIHNLFSTRPL